MEDFTNFLQPPLNQFESHAENNDQKDGSKDIENLKEGFSKLENEYQLVVQRTEDLEKYNINLQEQLSRYGIMLTEEKTEKKEILVKYETVQKEYHEKVESLFREKSLFEKRYYLLLGFLILLLIFLARTMLPPLFGWNA